MRPNGQLVGVEKEKEAEQVPSVGKHDNVDPK